MTSGPRRPCRALRQQRLYHWGKRAGGVARHATLKAEPVRKTGWRTVRHATIKAESVGKTG